MSTNYDGREVNASMGQRIMTSVQDPDLMPDDITPLTNRVGHDSVTQTLNLVGERWTMLLLREAYFGVRRYSQLARNLGIPRPTLSSRLTKLVDAGLLTRQRYAGGPVRDEYEYRLTQAGLDLFPAIVILMQWGDTYLGEGGRESLEWTHQDCGSRTHPRLSCDHCDGEVNARNLRSETGTD